MLKALLERWLRFNFVGIMGTTIQLCMLTLLKTFTPLHYLVATFLSVETALIHNFIWHEKWTWKKLHGHNIVRTVAGRLIRFHMASGLISLTGNLLLMRVFVGSFHIPYLLANLMAIAGCSIFNFLANDRLVFKKIPIPEP